MSNQTPVLTGVDVDQVFAENTVNATPQLLAPAAVYSDDGAADGAVITVSGLLAEDRITVVSGGDLVWDSGTGEITIGGVLVATTTGGSGANFVVTFNASATNDSVEDVIQALGYGNASNTPTASRNLTITVTDDDGVPNQGLSHFTPVQQNSGPFATFGAASMTKVAVGDYDGDGDDDLIVGGQNGLLQVYQNNGGTWAAAAVNPFSTDVGFWANPTFGDVDNDGDQDLVVGNYDGRLSIYRNDGAGAYTELVGGANPLGAIDVGSVAAPALYDFDSDGDADLLVGTWNGGLTYYRNDAGVFSQQTGAANPFNGYTPGWEYPSPTLYDLDGDGDQDLIFGTDGPMVLRENVGGQFVAWTKADPFNGLGGSFVGGHVDVAFIDTDGDGDADVAWSTTNGPIWPFRNVPDTGLTITVGVTAEYEPSVAINDDPGAYGSEATPTTGNLFWNNGNGMDYNPAGDPISIIAINGQAFTFGVPIDLPGGGKLTVAADGWWSFDSDGDFQSLVLWQQQGVSFTYTLNGGSTATVSLGFYGIDNNDVWVGGAGDDNMFMGNGADIFKGGDGNDIVQGEAGNDSLRGEAGDDQLDGGGDNDTLVGGDGADYLAGGMGDDILNGQAGVDTYDGWGGDDTFYLDVFDIVREYEGNGTDTIITAGNYWLLDGNDWWVENLTLSGTAASSGTGNSLNNVITGNGAANVLSGNAGADTLRGGGGDDTLNGGIGNDTADGGIGNDTLYGDAGLDDLVGGAGNDILYGGADSDDLSGGAGNDIYYLDDDVTDVITESLNGGTDTVHSAASAYTLGANIENLVSSAAWGSFLYGNGVNNRIEAGAGVDEIQGYAGNDVLLGNGGVDFLYGGAGLDILWGGADDDQLIGGDDNDQLYGEAGTDQLFGGAGTDKGWGGAGADQLYGEAGNDVLLGEANDDGLYGGDGNDTLDGGAGMDLLEGGAGLDKLLGGDDGDLLRGDAGNDTLEGGGGDDEIEGGADSDRLYGGLGDDLLYGQGGNDTLYGGEGLDTLYGGDTADKLYGEAAADSLHGGTGADTLDGGDGDDWIDGGQDADRLTGGAGADRFVFGADVVRLSGSGLAAQRDTILDFDQAAGDRIDLSGIDAIAGGADDAFVFVAKFTKAAGQAILIYSATTDVTTLRLDVDGDGRADHEIGINGQLAAGDPAWIL